MSNESFCKATGLTFQTHISLCKPTWDTRQIGGSPNCDGRYTLAESDCLFKCFFVRLKI